MSGLSQVVEEVDTIGQTESLKHTLPGIATLCHPITGLDAIFGSKRILVGMSVPTTMPFGKRSGYET